MLRSRSRPGLITRTSGAVAAPFSPLDLSPALWLDASDAATITQVANAVSQWNDKSGNGRHATQVTAANQPTTNTRTINGLNVIDFDGTNDNLDLPSGVYGWSNGDLTVFGVVQYDSSIGNRSWLTGSGSGSNEFNAGRRNSAGSLTESAFSTSSAGVFANSSQVVSTVGVGQTRIMGCVKSGSSQFHFRDGTKGSAATAATFTMTQAEIGIASSTFDPLNGVIAEIIVYTRVLSDSECNQVGAYLATKWGATWTPF